MGSNTRENFKVFCFSINMLIAPLGGDSPLFSPISPFKGKLSRESKNFCPHTPFRWKLGSAFFIQTGFISGP